MRYSVLTVHKYPDQNGQMKETMVRVGIAFLSQKTGNIVVKMSALPVVPGSDLILKVDDRQQGGGGGGGGGDYQGNQGGGNQGQQGSTGRAW